MRLPRRSLLALAAVLDVAVHARPTPVTSKALAQRLDLPARYLEPLLQTLVHRGLLKGTRGPRGGYELARERRRISVGDVVRAVDDAAETVQPGLVSDLLLPALAPQLEAFTAELDKLDFEALCARAKATKTGCELHDVGL